MPKPGGVPAPTSCNEEVCPWSSITLVELSDPNLASMPLRSLSVVSHMRRAPGGETQALSRYGLIPLTRAIASPDSSLLRHWLSHHLRSWVDPVGLHIAPYPRIDQNSIPSRIPL